MVLGNHPNNTPGNLFKVMVEGADRAKGDPHPVVQGPAAIDGWLDVLLKVAREKAKALLMDISDEDQPSWISVCHT